MRDHIYRLRDIPPEKRPAHFWEYYRLHVLIAIVLLSSLGYLLYGLLRPQPDLMVLWMSGGYTYAEENALRDALEQAEWLENGSRRKPLLTYLEFTADYSELSYQTMSEINTLVGGQQYSFFLVGEGALAWMKKSAILGSRADAGLSGEGELIIPVSRLPLLAEALPDLKDELYLVISSPDTGKNTAAEYSRQTEALRRFLNTQGIS